MTYEETKNRVGRVIGHMHEGYMLSLANGGEADREHEKNIEALEIALEILERQTLKSL